MLLIITDIKTLDDWYSIYGQEARKTLQQYKGLSILAHYGGSLGNGIMDIENLLIHIALQAIYPEHKWDESKFWKSRHYWTDMKNQKEFFLQLSKTLNITTTEGWYKITSTTLQQHGATGLLEKYEGSICKALTAIFPQYQKRFLHKSSSLSRFEQQSFIK